jgi:hypothetical protein
VIDGEVGSRAEVAADGADGHRSNGEVGGGVREQPDDAVAVSRRERVPAIGAVDRDPGDARLVALVGDLGLEQLWFGHRSASMDGYYIFRSARASNAEVTCQDHPSSRMQPNRGAP